MDIDKLPQEQADLVKSLQQIGLDDDEIIKALNINVEEGSQKEEAEEITAEETDDKVEKSIEDQIAEKQAELDELNKQKDLEKSEDNTPLVAVDEKFDELEKSFTNQLKESNEKNETRFNGLVDLVKSLTEKVVSQKEEKEELAKQNEDLKKSLDEQSELVKGATKVLDKIASYTPGLQSVRSLSGANHIERFEKSESGSEEKKLSVSKDKERICSMLSDKLENEEFRKSYADDITKFEIRSEVSDKLEKAIKDELGFSLTK
jgi:hypothetical protein